MIDDLEGAYQVGMMAIAGALTIASPLMSFVLAMVLFPSWLVKLQEEIDEVCGDRLPEMKDMEKLHTLRAVVKEVVRWRPPVPTGVFPRINILANCPLTKSQGSPTPQRKTLCTTDILYLLVLPYTQWNGKFLHAVPRLYFIYLLLVNVAL